MKNRCQRKLSLRVALRIEAESWMMVDLLRAKTRALNYDDSEESKMQRQQ